MPLDPTKPLDDLVREALDIKLSELAASLEGITIEVAPLIGLKDIAGAQINPATLQSQSMPVVPVQTVIARDANGLVSSVTEAAYGKTKTTTFTRDADGLVTAVGEGVV